MDNKKILMISPSLTGGGSERVMAILANEISRMHDVELCLVREKKDTYLIDNRVKLVRFSARTNSPVLKMLRRLKFMRNEMKKCDCIISFMYDINIFTLIAGFGLKKQIIISERGMPAKENESALWIKLGRKFLYPLANCVVFQTSEAQGFFPHHIQKKSVIIPNPLDSDNLPDCFEGEREKNIVAAGRLVDAKNFHMLLRGFAAFRKNHPDYRLTLYGEGPLRTQLESLAEELGIAESVAMPGYVSDVQHKMALASMYISTSNREGISNSMLEALGMGVPTIVTDCPVGGARMFVHTDENGILIPMEDVDALTAAMTRIADDPAYAERISRNATAIREELSSSHIASEWMKIIDRIEHSC